jgi:hypothetical protein
MDTQRSKAERHDRIVASSGKFLNFPEDVAAQARKSYRIEVD